VARGFGWEGRSVSKKDELVPAIKAMLAATGPYILQVQIPYQEHVLPMIPAGMTVRDLIKE
jgi:acetolactate synthase I/II/III large subunit